MTSTLTQYEFDRLELALQNSRHLWVPSPDKRPLQLAFEEIENLRRARPHVENVLDQVLYIDRGLRWLSKFPRSKKAKKLGLAYALMGVHNVEIAATNADKILNRRANVVRPNGTEEHA